MQSNIQNSTNKNKFQQVQYCFKYLLCLFIVFIITGCVNKPPAPNLPKETKPLVTTQVPEEVKPTPFELENIVSISIEPITTKIESRMNLYEMQLYNHSDEKIKLGYVQFTSNGRIHGTSINKTIAKNSSVSWLYQTDDILKNVKFDHYTYQTMSDFDKVKLVKLPQKMIEYKEYHEPENRSYLPLVPNDGFTIFTWQENDEWKFDYLLGSENDKIDYKNSLNNSMINEFLAGSINDTYFYIRSIEGNMDETMKSYIDEQMDLAIQYQDITYVIEGEEGQFEKLNNRFPYMETVIIFPKGHNYCRQTYCATRNFYRSNLFSFTEEQLASVGEKAYSVEEIIKEIKKYGFLSNFYVKGKDQQLTEDEAIEVDNLFKKHEMYIYVENMKYLGADKPVIYLYPEKEMEVTVEIDYRGELRTTYPAYNNGWEVIAKPDGTLINQTDGRVYSYLFWEGTGPVSYPMDEGFVVKREDTISFLQDTLSYLGLTPREYNEFIVYWLPYLQQNEYNLIVFQEEAYTEIAKLNIHPKPDSIQRIFMTFKGLKRPIDVKPQNLKPFDRHGFTVIEWGGVEITD